jgi:hydrogenase expression/formation protein HypC
MKIIKVEGDKATVEAGGLKKKIGLHLVKDVKRGDYVVVHAGFAIEKVDEKYAKETLDILKNIGLGR